MFWTSRVGVTFVYISVKIPFFFSFSWLGGWVVGASAGGNDITVKKLPCETRRSLCISWFISIFLLLFTVLDQCYDFFVRIIQESWKFVKRYLIWMWPRSDCNTYLNVYVQCFTGFRLFSFPKCTGISFTYSLLIFLVHESRNA